MGPLPAIFMQMDKEGVSGALTQSSEFTNACTLSCSIQAIEALRRLTHLPPRSRQSIAQFAATLIPQINKTVGRLKNGLYFSETMYLLNLLLRDENLHADFQLKIEELEDIQSLNLKTNELVFLPVQVANNNEFHMLLVYFVADGHFLAFDPNQGGSMALKPNSKYQLGKYKALRTVIRLSPRSIAMSDIDNRVDFLIQNLIDLKKVIQLSPLPIGGPGELTVAQAKTMMDRLITSLSDGQPALTADLTQTAPTAAASVLEIRHRVLEIQSLAETHDFFNYLRLSGLSNTANLALNVSNVDLTPLDSTIHALEQMAQKASLNVDDLQILRTAMQKYSETAIKITQQVTPQKAHSQLTPFFNSIKNVYYMPQIQTLLKTSDFVGELIIADWSLLVSARGRFNLN